ncbi:MAG: hypothetical protein IJS20_02210 [Bacteroidales bacterium]|nr:hypothetical protein [Bacteroidales bacterium]
MKTYTIVDQWAIKTFDLPNAEEYLQDINNISLATTGFINAWESNLFFDEATQLIVNAIKLFQLGYLDCAFYSLRQSIETSIGIIYLTANPDKKKDWIILEKGFESGKMALWISEKEPTFKDIREKMADFFDNVLKMRSNMNKYIHKQGYSSFYQIIKNPILIQENHISLNKIANDFTNYLKTSIGAVAIYRLAIDALPAVLMDEDIRMRSWDMITEPYSEDFVNKYIGKNNFESYKKTNIYINFFNALKTKERQNEAVYNLIHYQIFDRRRIEEYKAQMHLCSFSDLVAISIFSISNKISQLFVNGIHWYQSDIETKVRSRSCTLGTIFFDSFFNNKKDYNQPYYNSYLSRIHINDEYTYFEHGKRLSIDEIKIISFVEKEFSLIANKKGKDVSSLI